MVPRRLGGQLILTQSASQCSEMVLEPHPLMLREYPFICTLSSCFLLQMKRTLKDHLGQDVNKLEVIEYKTQVVS